MYMNWGGKSSYMHHCFLKLGAAMFAFLDHFVQKEFKIGKHDLQAN